MHSFLSPFVHSYYSFFVTTFDVVLICLFQLDAEDFFVVFEFAFNAVYEKYFVSKPARSCFEVAALPKGALVEIEAVALVN